MRIINVYMIKLPLEYISKFIEQFDEFGYIGVNNQDPIPLICCVYIPGEYELSYFHLDQLVRDIEVMDINKEDIRSYIYALDTKGIRLIGEPIILKGLLGYIQISYSFTKDSINYVWWSFDEGNRLLTSNTWDESPFYMDKPRDSYDLYMDEVLSLYSNYKRIGRIPIVDVDSPFNESKEHYEEYKLILNTALEVFLCKFHDEYPFHLITKELGLKPRRSTTAFS